MRRSDIKQLRRRLTCSAIRVWQQYTDVEKRLNIAFMQAQCYEVALAKLVAGEPVPLSFEGIEESALREQLDRFITPEARKLGDLATWYKSGHEQLNSMIAFAEQTIKDRSQ